jgi:hypothetical protein
VAAAAPHNEAARKSLRSKRSVISAGTPAILAEERSARQGSAEDFALGTAEELARESRARNPRIGMMAKDGMPILLT